VVEIVPQKTPKEWQSAENGPLFHHTYRVWDSKWSMKLAMSSWPCLSFLAIRSAVQEDVV